MNEKQIEPGMTYMSSEKVPVTALKEHTTNTALFVSEEYYPTPFVIWRYYLHPNRCNVIELYNGEYFMTLDQALEYMSKEV